MSTANPRLRGDVAALFVEDGGTLVPTNNAVGPWHPDSLHGAAVAAVFGSVLDRGDATVARVTVDLLSALPLRPLRLETSDAEGGRRVRRRTAILHDRDRPVARAVALYIAESSETAEASESATARGAGAYPNDGGPPRPLAPLPEERTGWPGFESSAIALHTVRSERGEMFGWFRLLVPPLVGRPLTGLPAALAAADYTSGATAMVLSLKRWTFMSTDLTLNLIRPPVGDWVGLTAGPALVGASGIGLAASVLHDASGTFARCSQTQFVRPRPAQPA